jgi:hypothetical protein
MIFRSLQLGLEFAFQMWEQKRGQEGKQNFDPEKQIILPSSNTLELGCQIMMPTKEAQSI